MLAYVLVFLSIQFLLSVLSYSKVFTLVSVGLRVEGGVPDTVSVSRVSA